MQSQMDQPGQVAAATDVMPSSGNTSGDGESSGIMGTVTSKPLEERAHILLQSCPRFVILDLKWVPFSFFLDPHARQLHPASMQGSRAAVRTTSWTRNMLLDCRWPTDLFEDWLGR